MLHACILVFQYALKHRLSAKALSELLLLLKVLLPAAANLPVSIYIFKRLFIKVFHTVKVVEHSYCKHCHMLADAENTNPVCECDVYDRFVAVPLAPQLTELMKGIYMHNAYCCISMAPHCLPVYCEILSVRMSFVNYLISYDN